MSQSKLPYLNLGCGYTYHKSWTNLDFVAVDENVIQHNLLRGIPFDPKTFEVVYHSHVLEHFSKEDAKKFLKECYRVLSPGGVLRVAVPDLEQIVVNYLKYLGDAVQGIENASEKYDWMMLELYDQAVRNSGGGEMLKYILDKNKNNDDFLLYRCGKEIQDIIDVFRDGKTPHIPPKKNPLTVRITKKIKEKLIRSVLGNEYKALQIGRFRLSGEIHQWMYDRFSLSRELKEAGFTQPRVAGAFESRIPGWESFGLDGMNGNIRKPDSLFMEAIRT